jgi:hypothetical protein
VTGFIVVVVVVVVVLVAVVLFVSTLQTGGSTNSFDILI